MKKLGLICLALLVALTVLGANYASWSQNLTTGATVSVALPPVVDASGANAGTTDVVLNGSLSQQAPGGAPVSVGFQYWPSADPGDVHTVSAGSVSSLNGTFSAGVSGLSAGTTYEYQSTGVGFFTVASGISTFTTGSAPALEVTTGSLPAGTQGIPYNQALQASGGSGIYTGWSIISGSLPAGLALTSGNIISGTPTTAGTYSFTVQVTDSSDPPGTATRALSIVIHAAASKLTFGQQPTSTTPGTAISPNVTVYVQDAGGSTVTTSSAVVSIAINNNPSGGALSGLQTVTAVNGVATFKYLSIDKQGTGYTLSASSSGLTGVSSNSFNIGARTTAQLSIETLANGSGVVVPAQNLTAGAGATVTGYAIERDASGNFIANVSGTWSLTNITGGVVSASLVPGSDNQSATFTDVSHLVGSATLHVARNALSSDSGRLTVVAGAATQVVIETAGNGSGTAITSQNLSAGSSLNAYAITRDAYGNFVANVSATWSLTGITGGVVSGDLTPASGASSTLTGHVAGSAAIHVVAGGFTANSGVVTITPGAMSKLVVTLPGQTFTPGTGNTGSPRAQKAGQSFNIVRITATDAYYNVVTSYNGARTLSYSGPGGSPTYTTSVNFTNGVSTTTLATTLRRVETTTITVSDGFTTGPASSSLTVNPGSPHGVMVYVPITLTNTQTTAVPGGSQVSLPINWSAYSSYLDNPVDNYVFFNSEGVPLYSWLESGTASTATSAVMWFKLDSNGIPAKIGSVDGTYVVYLGFYPTSTDKLGSYNSNYTGWAPNLSATYGQYDNGANVFVNYYRGDSTTGWSTGGTAGQTGTTAAAPAGSAAGFGTRAFFANGTNSPTLNNYLNINAGYSSTGNYIIQYNTYTTNNPPGAGSLGNLYFSASSAGLGTQSRIDTRASSYSGFARTASWMTWNAPITTTINSMNTWYQWSVVLADNGTRIADYYTTTFGLASLGTSINALGSTYTDSAGTATYSWSGSYIGLSGDRQASTTTTYWNGLLIRSYPPNGVMPSSAFGSLTALAATINIDSNMNWSEITSGSGPDGQPSDIDTVNVGVTNNTTLTVDVYNAECASLVLGHHTADRTGTLVFNSGSILDVNNLTIGASGTGVGGAGSINMTSGGTLNIGGPVTVNSAGTWTRGSGTVAYSGSGDQTVNSSFFTSYNNLTLSGSGAKTLQSGTTTISGNLTLSGTATTTTTANLAVGGNLNVGDGTTLTAGAFTLGVTGTTTVGGGTSGALVISSATGTKTFTGAVTIANGGSITETAAASLSFGSDLTINGTLTETGAATVGIAGSLTNNGIYTASTGVHTFSGTGDTLSGSTTSSIPSVAVTGTYTNSGTLTVGTALTGAGTLTNGATGILNISGTCSITTLSNTGTVAITGSGAINTAIANFTNTGTINLGGSGTIAGITNNAAGIVNLSSSGTIASFNNATSTSTLNISTTPTVPTFTTLTATAAGNTVNYNGAGNQTLKATTYVNLTLSGSGAKTFATAITINGILSMEGTATVTYTATPTMGASSTLQYNKPASFTAGAEWQTTLAGNLVIANTGAITQSTSGNSYAVSGTLTVNSGATLNMQRALSMTGATNITGTVNWSSTSGTARAIDLSGDVTLNSGAVWTEPATGNGANNTYDFGGNFTNNAATFTGVGTGIHTFSGTGKTIGGSTTTSIPSAAVTGTYTNNGTLTVTTALSGAGGLTNGATGVLNIGGTCSVTTLSNAGTINRSGTGATTTAQANFINTGIINITGSGTFTGITNNAGGVVNHSGSSTITSFNNATSTSTLNISTTPTVPTITTLTVSAAGNTVNYNGAGNQAVKAAAYSNLILSGSGAKSMITGTSVGTNGNLSIAPDSGGATASVGNGFTLTIYSLKLGSSSAAIGTWGSTASPATNKNSQYFGTTATGILNVTH